MIGRIWVVLSLAASLFAANPEPPKTILEQGSDHWAFKPIRKPAITKGAGAMDALVVEKLRKEGLSLSREAPRAILIRRLYLDLIGFPPDPEEVRAFVADT